MALGFKVADGYVEVHAHYDKGELERAAQDAADDHDKAFNKERERNSRDSDTRNTNRRIGGHASDDFIRGMREQIDRDRDKPIISVDRVKADATKLARVHVDTFEREAVEKRADRWRRIGTRISGRIKEGLAGKDGAGSAAAAFVTRFVEAVTFGQADMKSSQLVGKFARSFARLGTSVGIAFAAAFIAKAGSYITALSPLLLAAIGGLGVFAQIKMWGVKKEDGKWVINLATEMGRAIKGLKDEFKDFVQFATDPLFRPIITSIGIITDKLNALRRPVALFMSEFGKALPDLTTGAMDMIIEFFRALEPILKSGAFREGLKAWAREFPRIGRAIGEFFTKILQDPGRTMDAIKDMVDDIQTVLRDGAKIVTFLADVIRKWETLKAKIDAFENTKGGPLGGIAAALTRLDATITQKVTALRTKIANFFRTLWASAVQHTRQAMDTLKQRVGEAKDAIVSRAKAIVDGVVKFFKSMPGRVGAALITLPARIMQPFNTAAARAVQKAAELVTKAVGKLKELPGKARAAIANLWSRMQSVFTSSAINAGNKARDLVNKVINFLKTLPGKARSAVSSLWSSMSGAFSTAVSRAKTAASNLVNGFINTLRGIVAKARAQVNAAKNAIVGAFSGASGWLRSAGFNIALGLARGIAAGASAAVNAAVNLARRALAAAKNALGISSPSSVFAEEVGKPIAQGMGEGMRRQVPEEFAGLRGMVPSLAGAGAQAYGARQVTNSSSFSPTIILNVAAGLDPVNAAARRALTKDLFLALEQYRKDYVR